MLQLQRKLPQCFIGSIFIESPEGKVTFYDLWTGGEKSFTNREVILFLCKFKGEFLIMYESEWSFFF